MKFIDLFAGVGGFHLGLERANGAAAQQEGKGDELQSEGDSGNSEASKWEHGKFSCVWANEWDKYAGKIYQERFPKTTFSGEDIRKIEADSIMGFDLLVGGFPCQAFSTAGKREGFDDTRGTLFFEIARILGAKKPELCVLENVKGLLSHDEGRTFGRIIQVLDELGYWVEWQVLNSKDFGVPQNRERVFIVGHFRGKSTKAIFPITKSSERNNEEQLSRKETKEKELDNWSPKSRGRCAMYKSMNLVVHNLQPRSTNRPSIKKNPKSGGSGHLSRQGSAYCLEGGNSQAVEIVATQLGQSKQYGNCKRKGDAFTLKGSSPHGVEIGNLIRKFTPLECERLQGFPDNWTEGLSDSRRYACMGNAVTVNVIEAIGKRILETRRG